MIDVNRFNSVQLGLASPESIRRWSKGEVTKPETINYRTLKPEKDGLFDERIFGPTKDWECYCGKYKRIRYKGIICDKCGVEVTRSAVRRERMGHIELASPVSHIWYFKGTPSRLATLLDITPRELEQVLYFGKYIVTSIDEEARADALRALEDELSGRGGGATAGEESEIDARVKRQVADVERETRARLEQLEADRAERAQALGEAAQVTDRAIGDLHEASAEGAIVFEPTGEVVVAEGALGGREARTRLQAILTQASLAAEEDFANRRDAILADAEASKQRINREADEQVSSLRSNAQTAAIGRRAEIEAERAALKSLHELQLLPEIGVEGELDDFRSLDDRFGSGRSRGPRVFKAGMGAEAIREIIAKLDLDALARELSREVRTAVGPKQKRLIKRLKLVQGLRSSDTKPEWMILTVLPVIPPDIRPMVQLDGGRFATSDLNDLYRRVINRNNRLKRLLELGAPEIIVRNEKRMLQEAVDALIDNGRRGRAITGTGGARLKSLSDLLKGKQGRFRQNLLGKRVDYSGRSVIVAGPELSIDQCGLPKKMALELFKPFVMRQLVERGLAANIKAARRLAESGSDDVYAVLDEVIVGHPVLLNRAPTLHRLGIQAFMPVLVEGSAIRLHPLVCTAFNADFDGDQMAVHVPLSAEAIKECREILLSSKNLLSPADGSPIITPKQDIISGVYYLTMEAFDRDLESRIGKAIERSDASLVRDHVAAIRFECLDPLVRGAGNWGAAAANLDAAAKLLDGKPTDAQLLEACRAIQKTLEIAEPMAHAEEALAALRTGAITLHQRISVGTGAERGITTAGRVLLDAELPEDARGRNIEVKRQHVARLFEDSFAQHGVAATADLADRIKAIGFEWVTRSGLTMALSDIPEPTPQEREAIMGDASRAVAAIYEQFGDGLISTVERDDSTIKVWKRAAEDLEKKMLANASRFNPVRVMADSGARGNKGTLSQLGAMRGLSAGIDMNISSVPITSNFKQGMKVRETFDMVRAGRKGLTDTALRTADAGYLTRRLVDVAQDVVTSEQDCGTDLGILVSRKTMERLLKTRSRTIDAASIRDAAFASLRGRTLARREPSADYAALPLTDEQAHELAAKIQETSDEGAAGFTVVVRSPLTCESRTGICCACYGVLPATGQPVGLGTAVGVMAAQSIGEPGTQLTMRTFYTGGQLGKTTRQKVPVLDPTTGQQLVTYEEREVPVVGPDGLPVMENYVDENGNRYELNDDGSYATKADILARDRSATRGTARRKKADKKLLPIDAALFAKFEYVQRTRRELPKSGGKAAVEAALEQAVLGKVIQAGEETVKIGAKDLKQILKIVDEASREGKKVVAEEAPILLQRPKMAKQRTPVPMFKEIDVAVDVTGSGSGADAAGGSSRTLLGGLERIEELLEARMPRYVQEKARITGSVTKGSTKQKKSSGRAAEAAPTIEVRVRPDQEIVETHLPVRDYMWLYPGVKIGKYVERGDVLYSWSETAEGKSSDRADGKVGATTNGTLRGASLAGDYLIDGQVVKVPNLASVQKGEIILSNPDVEAPFDGVLVLESKRKPGEKSGRKFWSIDSVDGPFRITGDFQGDDLDVHGPFDLAVEFTDAVASGRINAGELITRDGAMSIKDTLDAEGSLAARLDLVSAVQQVYESQGVSISDKHVEVIARQMFSKVVVQYPGDSAFLPEQVVTRAQFLAEAKRTIAQGGIAPSAVVGILGITKASLATESFLSAASFQETTRVLTEATIGGHRDRLAGLKENVIVGKLIPAGTGAPAEIAARKERERIAAAEALLGGALPEGFGQGEHNPFLDAEGGEVAADDVSNLVALLTEERPAAEEGENPFAPEGGSEGNN
ncbi:MAG: DNA-directed polymerase subunit beta [Chloroflexota bacterium]